TSMAPSAIRSAIIWIDCTPDEQKRLMVIAGTSTGSPAPSAAMRATFMPCSASGIAQPITTSSISAPATPPERASASVITSSPSVSGRVSFSPPLIARPNGVRTPLTIATSLIGLVPQRLVVHEHVLHALAGFFLAAQREERLALEVEDVLLGLAHRR